MIEKRFLIFLIPDDKLNLLTSPEKPNEFREDFLEGPEDPKIRTIHYKKKARFFTFEDQIKTGWQLITI